jgi:hypothetical protein
MPKRRYLNLKSDDVRDLKAIRDRHPKAYMRERATALLKINSGTSPHQVALHGLLKPRDPDTIYAWMDRWEAEGLAGMEIHPGRGRKPAFSPSAPRGRGGEASDPVDPEALSQSIRSSA